MKLRNDIYKIGTLILLIVIASFIFSAIISSQTPRILSGMMVAVGLVSFFGFLGLGVNRRDQNLSKTDIRLATVVSVLIFYLVLVGTVSMFVKGGELPPISNTMLNHFTTVVGVVVAFYFGTEAYLVAQRKPEPGDQPDPGSGVDPNGNTDE